GHGGHKATLVIEPSSITLLGHAIADKREAGRAHRDQLMSIDRNISGIPASKCGFFSAVLYEVARHPMVLALCREVLDSFAPIAAVEFGTTFTGRTDENKSESCVVRHCHESSLAVARYAFN